MDQLCRKNYYYYFEIKSTINEILKRYSETEGNNHYKLIKIYLFKLGNEYGEDSPPEVFYFNNDVVESVLNNNLENKVLQKKYRKERNFC